MIKIQRGNSDGWFVTRGGMPVGYVRRTAGGFFRAGNLAAGISVGPIFSFLRAVRFALNPNRSRV